LEKSRLLVTTIRRNSESPIQVQRKRSIFHPRAQRNACRHRGARLQRRSFAREIHQQGRVLEQAEQFKDDYDNDDYSDYIENASVHAGD
jgi:hypothetical protein